MQKINISDTVICNVRPPWGKFIIGEEYKITSVKDLSVFRNESYEITISDKDGSNYYFNYFSEHPNINFSTNINLYFTIKTNLKRLRKLKLQRIKKKYSIFNLFKFVR
jgi:hypothetical protein